MYLPVILCTLQPWMSILNRNVGIRRKYNCEQDKLEHLKMSQIFLPTCSAPDTEFLCKRESNCISKAWGEPSKSSWLITNPQKKSSPSNCSFGESKVTGKHSYFKDHLGHKSIPFTWTELYIFLKKSRFCALKSTDFFNPINNMSPVIKQAAVLRNETGNRVNLVFKLK